MLLPVGGRSCSLSCPASSLQLEKLASAVEQQQGGDVGARVSFLVLAKTLLLSLGELSETQHLLTARRLYLLLERPLLELLRNRRSQVGPLRRPSEDRKSKISVGLQRLVDVIDYVIDYVDSNNSETRYVFVVYISVG